MLREPKKAETPAPRRKDKTTGRFRLMKLEERIAPHAYKKNGEVHKHGGPRQPI